MRMPISRFGLAVLLSGLPIVALAQDTPSVPPPASLAYIEGAVDLDHEGLSESVTTPTLLVEGDRVRTHDGRVEVVFADGSLLHADRDTTVEWLGNGHLRLTAGRVSVRTSASAVSYVVDTPPGAVRLEPRGEYDLGLRSGAGLQLSIARGVAELEGGPERLIARGGEQLLIDSSGRPETRRYNSARFDDFSQWAYDRASGGAYGDSARYLPPEVRVYGSSLDPYGRWEYLAPYGYVWYPRVAVGWRPYWHGGWRHTRYGWTWYGADPWSYATHHYGRWGFSGAAWFWIPSRYWGPAWVSWAFAPGFVSWCPLGWNGQPVVAFWNRAARVPHNPWQAWTAIPRNRFGVRGPIQSWVVDGRRIPETSRRAFIVQSAPPPAPSGVVARDYAIPRGTAHSADRGAGAPERSPGAVPRGAPSASWSAPGSVTTAPNSWSRPANGSVRRPQPLPAAPAGAAPVAPGTAPVMGDTTPSGTTPSAVPRRDPRADSQYAAPMRPPDRTYGPEDAAVFRGRGGARNPDAARPVGGQSPGTSWTPRARPASPPPPPPPPSPPASSAAPPPGAVERRPSGGEGRSATPPQARPSGGERSGGGSRGGVRRPPG